MSRLALVVRAAHDDRARGRPGVDHAGGRRVAPAGARRADDAAESGGDGEADRADPETVGGVMLCRFCGRRIEADDLLHEAFYCDGRQGKVEALEPLAPYRAHEHVRPTDPETSHAAAAAVEATATQAKRNVEAIFKDHPEGLNHLRLHECYEQRHGKTPPSTPRSRCCDLVREGRVVDSGKRDVVDRRRRVVWVHVQFAPVAA